MDTDHRSFATAWITLPLLAALFWTVPVLGDPGAEPLPNWLDPSERQAPPEDWFQGGLRDAPPTGSRLPAEYEPTWAVVIGWEGYTSMLQSIAQASYAAGAEVWCAGSGAPSSISGIPSSHYQRISTCPLDTVWMRDYGPYGMILPDGEVAITDSRYRHYQYRVQDDALPCCLAGDQSLDCYSINTAGSGNQWVTLDGGNVMVTTGGELYMTSRTYNWNTHLTQNQVDSALMEYFGVHTVRTIDYCGYPGNPADGTGHIDMIAKLLDEDTVLVANADGWTYDSTLEAAVSDFTGWGFQVVRADCWYSGGTWYTYTNSLIVNDHILIPSYSGHSADNAAAVAVYQAAMPGVTVTAINSDSSITAGGSIHCVTQLIPLGGDAPTATPTEEPTATATATPDPTPDPTGEPTQAPTPTAALTGTPEPTAPPGTLGVRLVMNSDLFEGGDPFHLGATTWNDTPEARTLSMFLLLEVTGQYWFWPDWTTETSCQNRRLEAGLLQEDEAILDFTWPDDAGVLTGAYFWGALATPDWTELVGDYHRLGWGSR